MKENIRLAASEINEVANTLEKSANAERWAPRVAELRAIAQNLMMGGMEPGMEFSPELLEQLRGMQQQQSDAKLNPNIPSFVQMKGPVQVGNTNVHTCTVTFVAPEDVSEPDIMNYILAIEEELGVDVKGFNWQVKEDQKKGV